MELWLAFKANHEKPTYFVLSQPVGKATCFTHRLYLYYSPKLARGPFSGPDGTWHISDHVHLIKLASCPKMSLTHTAAWEQPLEEAVSWAVLRHCPGSVCLSRSKALAEIAQTAVESHSPVLDPCSDPVPFPRRDSARDDNRKTQTILLIISGSLHFPRQLFV